jgi:peptide/nickel transport system ATP-binding protein
MSESVLAIRDLTVDLPPGADRPHAVENVSLSIEPDEILCVVGESGSGKSVLARTVMGLLGRTRLKPSGGQILFKGEDLLRASRERMRAIRGAQIAMIFQEPMTALNPVLPIGRQVDEVVAIHGPQPRAARKRRILDLFAAVALPDPERIYDSYPHELSGGQRQRAMIAMALILEPALIIADEPTTALDVTTQAQILKLIQDIQAARRTSVMFITHDFGVVAEIADRVAVMQRGRLVELGPARAVLENPQHAYTQTLIRAVPSLVPRAHRTLDAAPILLSVRGLEKTYGRRRGWFGAGRTVNAAKAVEFDLRRGETLGLVGESGSGKSTIARCVVRLVEADGGAIALDGVDLRALSRRALRPYRKRIQVVFQDPFGSLNPRLKVGALIAQGPIVHGAPRAEAFAQAHELLRLVGLDPRAADRYPHEFSGGQRQRIGIARALALRPDVLVADEPVSALDVSVQAQVLDLLADIRDRFALAMLFITHDLRVAAQVCDRVAVMRHGQIVEQGPTARLFAAPEHPYTRELLNAVPGREWSGFAKG